MARLWDGFQTPLYLTADGEQESSPEPARAFKKAADDKPQRQAVSEPMTPKTPKQRRVSDTPENVLPATPVVLPSAVSSFTGVMPEMSSILGKEIEKQKAKRVLMKAQLKEKDALIAKLQGDVRVLQYALSVEKDFQGALQGHIKDLKGHIASLRIHSELGDVIKNFCDLCVEDKSKREKIASSSKARRAHGCTDHHQHLLPTPPQLQTYGKQKGTMFV